MIIPFPVKKKIEVPKEVQERIDEFAKQYLTMLVSAVDDTLGEDYTDEEASEAVQLLIAKLIESFMNALDEED